MARAKIFINYRNGEHTPLVNELYEQLAHHFGADQVFLDRYTIRPGGRYPNDLRDGVAHADVLISIIHGKWLTERDKTGLRLLDRERDWVREELEIAIPDKTKTVIPLLVDDAARLTPDDLPASIAELAFRQSLRIRGDNLSDDVRALIRELELHVAPIWSPDPLPPRRAGIRWSLSTAAVLVVLVLPSLFALAGQPGVSPPPMFYVAVFSAFVMAARLVAVAVAWSIQRHVNVRERVIQRMAPTPYYRRIGIPAAVVILLFVGGTGVGAAVTDHLPNVVIYLTVAITVLLILANIATAVVRASDEESAEERRVRNWPQPLPLPPDPVVLRRELSILDDRMYDWRAPLTREQRDKAAWALAALRDYQSELVRQASLGFVSWLLTDQPSRLVRYLLWFAGTIGGLIAVVLPRAIRHLLSPVHAVIDILVGTAVVFMLCLSILDVDRRRLRNRTRAIDSDATESLDRLAQQLKELSWATSQPDQHAR